MRLGLLGGTFNPIHNAHLAIASAVRDRLSLNRVLFIPTGDPPHKPAQALAPAHHRFEMVRLAIEKEPSFGITDIEIRRTSKSYSIDTVRALQEELGKSTALHFILGLDAFLEFPTWKEAATLLRACHFVIVSRPGVSFASLSRMPLLSPVPPASLTALDAGQQDSLNISVPGEPGGVTFLRLAPSDISASEIRARLQKGLSLANLLPLSVESYIIRYNLYQEDADQTGL